MEKEKETRYKPLEKPELEAKEILPNCEDFEEPEKAEAIIRHLELTVGDTIREQGKEYIINPRWVLRGHSPVQYKDTIESLKKILTKEEIKAVSQAIGRRTKDYNKKLYDRITKRTDRFYWRGNIKKSLPQETKDLLEFLKSDNAVTGINNTLYHLLSKDKEDYLICYRCAWKGLPIPDQREWSEENDGEYRVLTDSEADQAFDDYFEDDYLWKQAVENGNTTSGFADWVEEVKNCDGRGATLNSYDGCEEEQEVNGTDYYIYRSN